MKNAQKHCHLLELDRKTLIEPTTQTGEKKGNISKFRRETWEGAINPGAQENRKMVRSKRASTGGDRGKKKVRKGELHGGGNDEKR